MRWLFQASVSNCSNPILCRLFLCIFPCHSCYYNPHHSYHTSSSAHLGVSCLRPSISVYHTRSFTHLSVSCLCPSMLTTHPFLPLPSGSGFYCMPIHPPILLLPLASCESARVDRSFFPPLGATTPPSWSPILRTLYPLYTPQIRDLAPPNAPRLPAIALCRSYTTGFLLPLVRLWRLPDRVST